MMEFSKHSYPKARKDHECEFCGKTIQKGEEYYYETGACFLGESCECEVDDLKLGTYTRKLCLTCLNGQMVCCGED